jgi:hypothetical protein
MRQGDYEESLDDEEIMISAKALSHICLERLRKTVNNLSEG